MKKELKKIANTLVLYNYHIDQNGLLDGKMGIILFFYRYARYADCKYYSELADELLDKVLAFTAHISTEFETGLTGIGWAVNYLIKNDYLDGESNDVLQDVDKIVFSNLKCDPEISVFGQGIYLLERLKDNIELEKDIPQALDFCQRGLSDYKGIISLYHINSILYILIKVDRTKKYTSKVKSIRNLIMPVLEKIWEHKLYNIPDILIFDQLLEGVETKQKNKWDRIKTNKPSFMDYNIETMDDYICLAWQQELYFGQLSLRMPPIGQVKEFITQKQENLTINDFLFAKGLAGLGNALLSQIQYS